MTKEEAALLISGLSLGDRRTILILDLLASSNNSEIANAVKSSGIRNKAMQVQELDISRQQLRNEFYKLRGGIAAKLDPQSAADSDDEDSCES